jgi:hypothetical protein
VHVQVDITRTENEASPKLKRVLAQFVLPMSGCTGSFPCQRIITAENMKERAAPEAHRTICLPLAVNQKRECDPSLLAKDSGVVCVAQANGGQPGAFIAECWFVVAQLRDVLAAEDSSVVPKEGNHCRVVGPKRAESDRPSFRVRQDYSREFLTHRLRHDFILK